MVYFLFLAALGLCCCAQAFSSCGAQASLYMVASLYGGFSCCKAQTIEHTGSVVVAHRLCGMWTPGTSSDCHAISIPNLRFWSFDLRYFLSRFSKQI